MALSKEEKKEIIDEFAVRAGDTGSTEVQIALLAAQIEKLAEHLEEHKGDVHSRRGLLSMVAKRRRLINYLQETSKERHQELMEKLEIKE